MGALAACSKTRGAARSATAGAQRYFRASNGKPPRFTLATSAPRHEARLAFRVGGKVVARLVDVGATVKPGQALARLEDNDASPGSGQPPRQAGCRRGRPEAERSRHQALPRAAGPALISQAEFDCREVALLPRAAISRQRWPPPSWVNQQRDYTTLTAERAGVVTSIDAEVGQVVSAGQLVARVAESGEREAVIAVAESQLAEVRRARGFIVQGANCPASIRACCASWRRTPTASAAPTPRASPP